MGYFLNFKTTQIEKLIARDYHEPLVYSSVQKNIYTHTFILELRESHYRSLLCHFNKQKQFVMYKREIDKNETVVVKKCDGVDLKKGFSIEKCDSSLIYSNNNDDNDNNASEVQEAADSLLVNDDDSNTTKETLTESKKTDTLGIKVYNPKFQSEIENVTYLDKYEKYLNDRREKKVRFQIEETNDAGDEYTSKSFYRFVHMMDNEDDVDVDGDYVDDDMGDYEEDDLSQFIINDEEKESAAVFNPRTENGDIEEKEANDDCETSEKNENTDAVTDVDDDDDDSKHYAPSSCVNYYTIDVDILYDHTRLDPVEPLMICMLNGVSEDYEDFKPYISMVYNFDTNASELYTAPVTSVLAPTDEMECKYYRDYGSRMTLIKDDFENATYYKKLAATGFWKKSDDGVGTFFIGARQYFDRDSVVLKYFISFISESKEREIYDFKHLKSFVNSSKCETTFDSLESYVYPPVHVTLF